MTATILPPIEITIRDIPETPTIVNRLHQKATKLIRFDPRITFCRVVVEVPQKHQLQGKQFKVAIEIHTAKAVVIATHNLNEDLYVAIRDAFKDAGRQLEDHIRRLQHRVKTHAAVLQGRIVRLFGDYGFIESNEGEEYYFNENFLTAISFNQLKIDDAVEFIEAVAGDSLQAHQIKIKRRKS